MRSRRLATLAALLTLVLTVAVSAAQARPMRGRWVSLGSLRVSDQVERDVLRVTGARGDFRAIQIRVQGRPVQFHDVKVNYANGETQDIELRNVIPAGGESRAIDLSGRERVIRSIEFVYDSETARHRGRGRSARVSVFGMR